MSLKNIDVFSPLTNIEYQSWASHFWMHLHFNSPIMGENISIEENEDGKHRKHN